MQHSLRRLVGGAAVAAAAFASPAFAATVLDFESTDLTGLYFAGEGFSFSGYSFAVTGDFGTIDTAAALGFVAPTGNNTQFYFNSNDGALTLTSSTAVPFNLNAFSAAFVPLTPASGQTTVIVARGTTASNAVVTASWAFGASATSNFPFSTYSNAADFSAFTNLNKVEFFACSIVGSAICTVPTANNGQFAIDDITVTAVPEPAPAALLTLGLAALALRARRARR